MVLGIHHVTAIASDAQQNVDFYVGVLGLRMVKKTVNFDDPTAYHLYYGDGIGTPGTLMTFFPYGDILPGTRGQGETASVTFEVPIGSLDFWKSRLSAKSVPWHEETVFGQQILWALDPDGLRVELEEVEDSTPGDYWQGSAVPFESAIRAIRRVTLTPIGGHKVGNFETSEQAFTELFGFSVDKKEGLRERFLAGQSEVDVIRDSALPRARSSAGSVHHIAFRIASAEVQEDWLRKLLQAGFNASPVMERNYFKSIYFREPGGILFEFATDGPGMMIDEPYETLGESLLLPAQHENRRQYLMSALTELKLP